jgi:hypothetical protein
MARTTRQTVVFGVEDWKRIYQTYREGDFQSYDFETLRKSFVDYLRLYYPETFNDYIESSEFIALLDVMAFQGQALAFRTDLNTRENFLDTAERRDSVVKLANLVGYTPKRNTPSSGYLKVFSVQTTENVIDYNGVNLASVTVNWADPSNFDWQEQFSAIINASLLDTQRVGVPANRQDILGVETSEYTINLVPGFLPVVPFTATIDGVNMPFEAVTATSKGADFVYEPSPLPNGRFNVLFRNDTLGFQSANTGYFFYFKQGILQNQDFNLPERISNRVVNINIEGCNNQDHWLYQLDNVGNISTEWIFTQSVYGAAVEQLSPNIRNLYSITSRVNDQISLNFGDGVFSQIPVGTFRAYVRASNGLQYIINPSEMQSVLIPISYVSRTGQIETITFTCGITNPISNAQARETIDQIKQRAPARYYTQDRMVNGEDYTNFPFATYNSILKSSAVNRASIGTSRYLDLVDNTGKYSSTNSFASDGALYDDNSPASFTFSWQSVNDITDAIVTKVEPQLTSVGLTQFYYANFPRPPLAFLNVSWFQSTTLANETTGYFKSNTGGPIPIGQFTSTNFKYVVVGSLVKFVPPTGYYFNKDNRLILGVPTSDSDKLVLWASPSAVFNEGTNQGAGNFADGVGPVVLNNFIPTGAIASEVIPLFVTDLPASVEVSVAEQISFNQNFGIGYNNLTQTWYVIGASDIDIDAPYSQDNQQSTAGINNDASWLIQFVTNGAQYTVQVRNLLYYFGSVLQTRFFYFTGDKIYDPRTGVVISDFINVLKTNSRPDSNLPLSGNNILKIVGQPIQSDGFVDDYQVLVSYQDNNGDGVPENPDFFNDIVAPNTNPNQKLVFFQSTVDFDNLQRYLLLEPEVVNSNYATINDIEAIKTEFSPGQIFYAYTTELFYVLTLTVAGQLILEPSNEYLAKTGRQSLFFQYRHNAPLNARIDPGSTNIIDLYIVTLSYYTAYQNWIKDITGTVPEPSPPTIDDLTTEYTGLQNYKMVSDNLILNSVEFLPLFGSKAPENLRATIKVIAASNTTASISEIKNSVVQAMDAYFTLDKWDFGETFYFSELAAYIHSQIGGIVSSVVLVPLNTQKSFGDLYEIRSAPYQIFVNGATADNIEVITALTSNNLQTAPGSGVI